MLSVISEYMIIRGDLFKCLFLLASVLAPGKYTSCTCLHELTVVRSQRPVVREPASPIAKGYRKLCGAMIICASV